VSVLSFNMRVFRGVVSAE